VANFHRISHVIDGLLVVKLWLLSCRLDALISVLNHCRVFDLKLYSCELSVCAIQCLLLHLQLFVVDSVTNKTHYAALT